MQNLVNEVVHVPKYMLLSDPTGVDPDELHPVMVLEQINHADYLIAPIRKLENSKQLSSDFFIHGLPVVIDEEFGTLLDDETLIEAIVEASNESPCGVDPIQDWAQLSRREQVELQLSWVEPMPMF